MRPPSSQNNRPALLVAWAVLIACLPATLISASAPSHAYFGTGIVYLLPPADGTSWITLAPTGDFAAGVTYEEHTVTLNLWDLRNIDPFGELGQIPPAYTQKLPILSQTIAVVFSTDGRLLVVQTASELRLLRVPDLQLVQSVATTGPAPWPFTPTWSSDGELLATLAQEGQEIVVWDRQTDQRDQYLFEHTYDRVYPFGEQWLIASTTAQNKSTFALCSKQLEWCVQYPGMGYVVAVAEQRQLVVTERQGDIFHTQLVIGAWSPRADGILLLNEQKFVDFPRASIRSFSPDEQFFAAQTADGLLVWDFDTLEPVHQLLLGDWGPVWLSEKFVVAGGYLPESGKSALFLHSLNQEEALDRLTIDTTGLDDFILPEAFGLAASSANGRWLLFNLGRGALLIPIVYE